MKKILSIAAIAMACQSERVTIIQTKGCEKEPSKIEADYIVFGTFYGECIGENCIQLYLLTNDSLYADTKKNYPTDQPYDGSFKALNSAIFEKVSDLNQNIPNELLDIKSIRIGQPDAYDQGGIYFEIKTSKEQKFWLIDMDEDNIPDSLKSFVKTVQQKVKLINN